MDEGHAPRVGIIGGGLTGLTAAYELTKLRYRVTVYEASDQLGGLGSGFKASGWDWHLDRFYHHLFQSDWAVQHLSREVGAKFFFRTPVTALWYQGHLYPFDRPTAILRFPHLTWMQKFRFGLVTLYLRLLRNWSPLERTTAHEWLLRALGPEIYEIIWQPLLTGKFPKDWQRVNMAWFWARVHKRSTALGYYVGGFQALMEKIAEHVRNRGGEIHLRTPVHRITAQENGIVLQTDGSEMRFDRVIATVPAAVMADLAPDLPADYMTKVCSMETVGAQVLILALKYPLTEGFYWLNLPLGEFPFLALVEHTNYIDSEYYGGDHIIYLGDYPSRDDPRYQMTKEDLLNLYLPALRRFNPSFTPDWIRDSWLCREPYAQPVVPVNYSQQIPSIRAPIPGLYLATMSQVYPWDRGSNYAVELGQEVARLLHEDAIRHR